MSDQDFLNNMAKNASERAAEARRIRDEAQEGLPTVGKTPLDKAVEKLEAEAESAHLMADLHAYYNPPEIKACDSTGIYLTFCFLPMAFFLYFFDILLQTVYDCWLNLYLANRGIMVWIFSFYFLTVLIPPVFIITGIGAIPLLTCMFVYRQTGSMGYAICALAPLMGITLLYIRYIPSLAAYLYFHLSYVHEVIFRLTFGRIKFIRKLFSDYKFKLLLFVLIPITLLFIASSTKAGCRGTLNEMFKPHHGKIIRYHWNSLISKTFFGYDIPPEVYGLSREIHKGKVVNYNPHLEKMVQLKKQQEQENLKRRSR